LGEGNISYYSNAYILQTAPIILIGTAISTAAFPRLTNRLAQGRPDLFRRDFLMVLRAMIWITLPVVVLCYFCRGYLARLIFAQDAPQIALIFGFLCGAIFFRTLYAIISRWFYAQKDTRTPLYVSLFSIALNVFLVYSLARPASKGGYDISGLAIAQSVVAAIEVLILLAVMIWRDHRLFTPEFWNDVLRTLSVTGFTVMTAYIMVHLAPLGLADKGFIKLTAKLSFIVIPTLIVHIGVSALFGLDEVRPVIRKLRQLVLAPVRIQ
jgi:putative peptidoglycan lipid II flippase